jgi:polar amino acid transport system substrate-binding protein
LKSDRTLKKRLFGGKNMKIKSMLTIAMLIGLIAPVMGNELAPSVKHLVYITEQFPPFNFQEDGILKGISVDLMDRMLNRMDMDLNRSSVRY